MANNEKINQFKQQVQTMNLSAYFNNDQDKISRFKRTLFDAYSFDDKLQECPVETVIQSATKGAMLNLELNRHFNIIPRKDRKGDAHPNAKFELNYQGYVTLLARNGIIARANAVYSNDIFDVDFAMEEITHKPNLRGSRGELVGVYAILKIDDSKIIDFINAEEITEFKTKFLFYESGAWKSSLSEMAKKTILKRTSKPYINIDSVGNDVREAVALDNATETNNGRTLEARESTPLLDVSQIKVNPATLPQSKLPPVEPSKPQNRATEPVNPADPEDVKVDHINLLMNAINFSYNPDGAQIFIARALEFYGVQSLDQLSPLQYSEVLLKAQNAEAPIFEQPKDIADIKVNPNDLPNPSSDKIRNHVEQPKISSAQVAKLMKQINSSYATPEEAQGFIEIIKAKYDLESINDLNLKQFDETIHTLISDTNPNPSK